MDLYITQSRLVYSVTALNIKQGIFRTFIEKRKCKMIDKAIRMFTARLVTLFFI